MNWDICNVFLKLTVLIDNVSINIYLKYNKYKKLNFLLSAEFKALYLELMIKNRPISQM